MKSSAGLPFKTYLLIFLMVIFGPLGNVLLGKGMKRIDAASIAARGVRPLPVSGERPPQARHI